MWLQSGDARSFVMKPAPTPPCQRVFAVGSEAIDQLEVEVRTLSGHPLPSVRLCRSTDTTIVARVRALGGPGAVVLGIAPDSRGPPD